MRTTLLLLLVAASFLTEALLSGCSNRKVKNLAQLNAEIFERIRIGMSRPELEMAVGKPLFEFHDRLYFGKEESSFDPLRSLDSPYPILVIVNTNKVVVSKTLYSENSFPIREGRLPWASDVDQ